jgi:hypothetical protein
MSKALAPGPATVHAATCRVLHGFAQKLTSSNHVAGRGWLPALGNG